MQAVDAGGGHARGDAAIRTFRCWSGAVAIRLPTAYPEVGGNPGGGRKRSCGTPRARRLRLGGAGMLFRAFRDRAEPKPQHGSGPQIPLRAGWTENRDSRITLRSRRGCAGRRAAAQRPRGPERNPPPVRSCASFTLNVRPSKSVPFNAAMARAASALDISTKPNPRGRPVSRSLISATFSTVPWFENNARTLSSVAEKGRFPTYSFVTAILART